MTDIFQLGIRERRENARADRDALAEGIEENRS